MKMIIKLAAMLAFLVWASVASLELHALSFPEASTCPDRAGPVVRAVAWPAKHVLDAATLDGLIDDARWPCRFSGRSLHG